MPSGTPIGKQEILYITTFRKRKTVGQIATELNLSRKAVSQHIREAEKNYK